MKYKIERTRLHKVHKLPSIIALTRMGHEFRMGIPPVEGYSLFIDESDPFDKKAYQLQNGMFVLQKKYEYTKD